MGSSSQAGIVEHDSGFSSQPLVCHALWVTRPAAPYLKKDYLTFVVEHQIAAPRAQAWQTMLDLMVAGTGGYTQKGHPAPHGLGATFDFSLGGLDLHEEVISFEPPWRRVYQLTGAPVALYEGTTVFTDHGEGCLFAWSLLIDPLPGEASEQFVATAQKFIAKFSDHIKTSTETRS
ncbi:MAG: hypothetical protein HN361_03590 [Actinobacteria bacterium]|jgi:hypothetical protein|nr:hypothetical protein [Actinomycetota bacterium]MBT3746447.1 hypothetical protein [Actinomycetota bacterium]MBT3969998.1 hypothetical protein [Actinomycetota bacterium]MBT4010589.1 hypothetical protein [Actinomycetota bacterium]MBT4303444.1 hypothetical protein [Actinomycetota bacterium]